MDSAQSKSPPWHSAVTLMWRSHPWLTLGTVLTGLVSGIASIVGVGLISTVLRDPSDRQTLLLMFIAVNVIAVVCRSGAAVMPSYACMKVMTRLRVNLCKGSWRPRSMKSTDAAPPCADHADTGHSAAEPDAAHDTDDHRSIRRADLQHRLSRLSLVDRFRVDDDPDPRRPVLYLFFYRKAVNFTERVRDEFVQFNEYTHGLVFGIKELKLNRARRRWFTRAAIELSSKRVAGFNYIERFWFMSGDSIGQITVAVLLGFLLFGVPSLGVVDPSVLTASILAVLYMMGLDHADQYPAGGGRRQDRTRPAGGIRFPDRRHAGRTRNEPPVPGTVASPSAKSWKVIELNEVTMNYRVHERRQHRPDHRRGPARLPAVRRAFARRRGSVRPRRAWPCST